MIKIGAIWMKDKDGKNYGSGRVELDTPITLAEGLNILLFKPREARENGPTYEVFVSKPKPKDETDYRANPPKKSDDNIPF
jgi:hypothetical protein